MAPCHICDDLVASHPVHEVGEHRDAPELAALVAAARQHIAYRHVHLVGAFNLALQLAALVPPAHWVNLLPTALMSVVG